MRKNLMFLLLTLCLSSVLTVMTPRLVEGGNYPFNLEIRTASEGTTVATPTYDTVTPTVTNPLQVVPVDIMAWQTTGFLASVTVAVTTATAVIMPALTAGVKKIRISTSADMNIGGSDVGTGAGPDFIPANSAGVLFCVSTSTPLIYFRGRSGNGTVYINQIRE